MEIEKINLNGVVYDIGLERYISYLKPAEIISQNHQLTLQVDELANWYQSVKPDYTYFTFTSTNKQLQLYTSRGNSCPSGKVYLMDCVKDGLSQDDLDELNDRYGISCTDTDKITIYYGD